MAKILIVYGSTEGHTAKITARMAAAMRTAGHTADLRDARDLRGAPVPEGYDGVVVAGSVHAGEHQSSVREFARRNAARLAAMPAAFVSVSLSAAEQDDDARHDTHAMVERFIAETGWHPARVECVAGALVYTQYNFFTRHLMKLIVKRGGRAELDTTRDYDFTDWPRVEAFGRDFAGHVQALTVA